MMDKNIFRKECIQVRKDIQDKELKSKSIVHKILNHPKYIQANTIACLVWHLATKQATQNVVIVIALCDLTITSFCWHCVMVLVQAVQRTK